MNGMFASRLRRVRRDMLLHVLLRENRTSEARPSVMKSSSILRGRDSFRYFDRQLEGGGGVRTGDSRFAAGERTIGEGSELLP
jgi:hypothetical protein